MGLFDKLFGGKSRPHYGEFTPTDALMDESRFWEIIQTTKDAKPNDFASQQDELAKLLRKMTPDQIILFDNRFRYFRGLANTWPLWGAIYIIHGGCGDDSFNDFREWVIGQGKEFYHATIQNPETLVEVDSDKIEDADWEGLGYIASTVFKELTGKEIPYLHTFNENTETTGTEWSDEGDDLKNMFPKLAEKYPDHI